MHDAEYARKFWARVEKTEGCWLWQSSVGKPGYGIVVTRPHKNRAAHRVSWELTRGPIPPGMYICHRCDVPRCVNPAHLFLGSPTDNVRDAMRKGRAVAPPRPARPPMQKLTARDAREIRRLWAAGSTTQRAIAKRFGVSPSAVSRVILGRTHVQAGDAE